jgi:uncharacterized phage protein gp47/JayE
MPINRPTLEALISQGASELESRLPGVLARARNSVVGVLNRVFAGGLSSLYKYVEALADQWWPDRAAPEFLPEHGARWGVPQVSAAAAAGAVQFGGTDGSVVPLGTVVQRADGVQYSTTVGGAIGGGVVLLPITAVLAGQAGNCEDGTVLSLVTPIAGVNTEAATVGALTGGADVEDIEAWRARILARIRKPPQGGAADDYLAWAYAVPGVTRAWVEPNALGAGTVVVRFVRDDDVSFIPGAPEVAAVQAAIDAVRPVTATVTVLAPVATPQNFTIALLPDTGTNRAAVQAELADLYRRAAEPGGTMLLSQQREAISIATGEVDHVITVPAANQVHTAGQLPTLGVITWA